MSWYTLEEAQTLGPSADGWLQRVQAEEVSSYVDGHGRRWVWIDGTQQTLGAWGREPELVPLWKDVASLRQEVVNLSERRAKPEPEFAVGPKPLVEPAAPEPFERQLPLALTLVEREPVDPSPFTAPAAAGPASELLAEVAATWTASDRELERQANLPKAFLAKAKKGLRNGPRSAGTWARLEGFLRNRRRRAA